MTFTEQKAQMTGHSPQDALYVELEFGFEVLFNQVQFIVLCEAHVYHFVSKPHPLAQLLLTFMARLLLT